MRSDEPVQNWSPIDLGADKGESSDGIKDCLEFKTIFDRDNVFNYAETYTARVREPRAVRPCDISKKGSNP